MARLFKTKADVDRVMNSIVLLHPIDPDDLEILFDRMDEMFASTEASSALGGRIQKPLNRELLRTVNSCFGTGRSCTPAGVWALAKEAQKLPIFGFTPEDITAIYAMVDVAVIPMVDAVDQPEL